MLLYFPDNRRAEVLGRLADALVPDGVLILGAGETVLGRTDAFRPDPEFRGCYRRTGAEGAGAGRTRGVMPSAA